MYWIVERITQPVDPCVYGLRAQEVKEFKWTESHYRVKGIARKIARDFEKMNTVLKGFFFFTDCTVGEHAGGCELDVWQGPEVVQHGAAVALFLRVIHKGADVVLLTVVSDAWADNHGDVRCRESEMTRESDRKQFACWLEHV